MTPGRRDLLLVLGVALAVRVGFVLLVHPLLASDLQTPDGYDDIAASLAAGRGFLLAGSPTAAAERLPLYPLLLAASLRLFGAAPLPWQLAQCLLDAATCVLVLATARRYASRAGALAAGLACALHPTLVLYVARPLTETLYVFLLVALVHAIARSRWGAAGWWLGLGLLVKSSALLHAAAFLPALVTGGRRGVARAALVAALVVLPWAGWNVARFGTPHLLTATGGRNLHQGLFISQRVGWTTPVRDLNREADWALWDDLKHAGYAWTGDVTYDDAAAGRVARDWIAAHPAAAVRLWTRNVLLTWYLARSGASMAAHALLHALLLALAAVGAARLLARPETRALASALVLLVAAYTLAHAVIKPGIRYVLPAVPPATLLMAAALPLRLRRPAAPG